MATDETLLLVSTLTRAAELIEERGFAKYDYVDVDGSLDIVGALCVAITGSTELSTPADLDHDEYDLFTVAKLLLTDTLCRARFRGELVETTSLYTFCELPWVEKQHATGLLLHTAQQRQTR